ncbi:MAG: hypothetical protein WCS37_10120 [Chloroflexota bacterium]
MKLWNRFLAKSNQETTLDQNPAERERDARFSAWLEEEGTFRASSKFQSDLRTRLLVQATTSPKSERSPSFSWFRLIPAGVGLVALLAFALILVSTLSSPASVELTQVAGNPALGTTPDLNGDKLNSVYDQATEDYLNLDETTTTLGFAPSLPQYLPPGYQLENVALTYGEPPTLPNRVRPPVISPIENVLPQPHGLQFQLTSLKAAESNHVQVYQLLTPATVEDSPHFNIQGAQRFTQQAVQGAVGYFIQGTRWRVAYSASVGAKMATPHPSPMLRNRMMPPKIKGTIGRMGMATMPSKLKASAKIAFSQNQANGSVANTFFIDFQPREDGKSARSLVWAKNGVLTVLVGGDSVTDDELHRIAESFKPIVRHS